MKYLILFFSLALIADPSEEEVKKETIASPSAQKKEEASDGLNAGSHDDYEAFCKRNGWTYSKPKAKCIKEKRAEDN